jgi:hypothetical protein
MYVACVILGLFSLYNEKVMGITTLESRFDTQQDSLVGGSQANPQAVTAY